MSLNNLKSWNQLTEDQKNEVRNIPAFKGEPDQILKKFEYEIEKDGINIIDKKALVDIFNVERKQCSDET